MNFSACISKSTLLLSFGLVCLLGHGAKAQVPPVFTNAAFEGRYAVSLTFGANNGAGLGVVTADGAGNLRDGSLLLHVPTQDGEGQVLRGQLQGQYHINPNGTAILMAQFTFPNQTLNRVFDLVVRRDNGVSRIIELFGAVRERSDFVPGVGVTIELRRLPAPRGFDNASLDGPLSFELSFESQAAIGFGMVTANKAGHLVDGVLLLNVPGPDREREIIRGQVEGTYTVNPNGTVTMNLVFSFPDGRSVEGTFDLMITEEQPSGPAKQGRPRMARNLMGSPRGYFDIFPPTMFTELSSKTLQQRRLRGRVNRIILMLTCEDPNP
ncbi:MAG TPA: hypothetical protein VNM72_04815 [Blastocatellia bacterium]|nr:hypothetical protein [Blastocatellia bacterium]